MHLRVPRNCHTVVKSFGRGAGLHAAVRLYGAGNSLKATVLLQHCLERNVRCGMDAWVIVLRPAPELTRWCRMCPVWVCAADAEQLRLMLERSRLTAVAEAAAARANSASLNKQVCKERCTDSTMQSRLSAGASSRSCTCAWSRV